jgi:hypothetical protein
VVSTSHRLCGARCWKAVPVGHDAVASFGREGPPGCDGTRPGILHSSVESHRTMKRIMLGLVMLGMCVITIELAAGPDLWAAPSQSPGRQSVPTRTSQPSPTKKPAPPPTSPPPTAQPTPVPTTTVEANIPSGGASEPLLPQAGGRSFRLLLVGALTIVGLFVVVVAARRLV